MTAALQMENHDHLTVSRRQLENKCSTGKTFCLDSLSAYGFEAESCFLLVKRKVSKCQIDITDTEATTDWDSLLKVIRKAHCVSESNHFFTVLTCYLSFSYITLKTIWLAMWSFRSTHPPLCFWHYQMHIGMGSPSPRGAVMSGWKH